MLVNIHPHMGGINQAAIDTWERLQNFFPNPHYEGLGEVQTSVFPRDNNRNLLHTQRDMTFRKVKTEKIHIVFENSYSHKLFYG